MVGFMFLERIERLMSGTADREWPGRFASSIGRLLAGCAQASGVWVSGLVFGAVVLAAASLASAPLRSRDIAGVGQAAVSLSSGMVSQANLGGQSQRDRVVDLVRTRNGIVVRGRLLAYEAEELRVRVGEPPNEREVRIKTADVDRVDVQLDEAQRHGEQLYRRGQYLRAAELLREALGREDRGWLRRRICARLIAAQLALGNRVKAIEVFLAAVRSEPRFVQWEAVPLCWELRCADEATEKLAERLVRDTEPAAALIGASWLFGTDRSDQAKATLAQLKAMPVMPIAALAELQLWRWAVRHVGEEQLAQWHRRVERLPAELRAGAYFLIGLAHYHRGSYDRAALALLWPALVLRSERELSQQALWLAAKAELAAGHGAEAGTLLEEYLDRYPTGPGAEEARRQLDLLGSGR